MVKIVTIDGYLGISSNVDYSAISGTLEFIIQKVRMLISTPRGSLSLQRDFGYDPKIIDKPFDIAFAGIKFDLESQFKKWIPEVALRDIKLKSEDNGKYYITLQVEVNL